MIPVANINRRFVKKHVPFCCFVLFCLTMIAGCSSSGNLEVDRGSGYNYVKGFPEVRFSSIGLFDNNGISGIDYSIDIVYGSIIYKKSEEEQFRGLVQVELQIIDLEEPNKIIQPVSFTREILSNDGKIINSQDVLNLKERFETKPGTYSLLLTVTDMNSSKQTTQKNTVTIPNPEKTLPDITSIQLLGKDAEANAQFGMITTYDVPERLDSLRFLFQVTNSLPDQELQINTKLVKYRADSDPARLPTQLNYNISSIQFRGIDYSKTEVIQENTRTIFQQGYILIQFEFSMFEKGNYRFEVTLTDNAGEVLEVKARDFSIKGAYYPSLKSPKELLEPLFYIMPPKEYKRLIKMENPDSLKQEIDRFWLSNIRKRSTARQVISLYYERVEEANKQFSNFKEGWKTDPGMVYILFGPPLYVEEGIDGMVWSYTNNFQDGTRIFRFSKERFFSDQFPFNHFILSRSQFYYNEEFQQIEAWKSGRILTLSL